MTKRTIEIIGYPNGNIINLTQNEFDYLYTLDNDFIRFDDEWTKYTPDGQWGFDNDDEEELRAELKKYRKNNKTTI